MRFAGVVEMASLEGATNLAKFAAISTNPEAFLIADPGSFVLQRRANTFDRFPWWKDSGTGNTGWQRVLKQISNNTANRPGYNASTYTGLPYCNTETDHGEVYAGTALGWLPFDSLGAQAITGAGALNLLRRTNTFA
jgi:hypothetical protein